MQLALSVLPKGIATADQSMVADRVKVVQAFVKQALGLEAEPEETHGVVTVCQIVSHQIQIKCFSRNRL